MLLQQTSIDSRFIQDQLLPQNTLFPTYHGSGNWLHINMEHLNKLIFKDLVIGLPKLKF